MLPRRREGPARAFGGLALPRLLPTCLQVRAPRAKARDAKAAELEASGKKVSGGLHKFDASEVDQEGGAATADDFMDAFGF